MSAVAGRLAASLTFLRRKGRTETGSRVRGLPELGGRIRQLCRLEGLGEQEAIRLVTAAVAGIETERIDRAFAQIFSGDCPDDSRAAIAIAHELEERFGEPLNADDLAGPLARLGSMLARGFGAILGVTCFYLVLGGLLAGESERFPGLPGPVALVFFAFALAFLGLFEALHTSVTQLRLADLRGLAEAYPRALALHRRFRDEVGISRVLAGRQIVVVVTVFLVAGLSSFPHMTVLPFTEIAVPSLFEPFIRLGIPGALVVLWVAQLAPQFYATRNAVGLMNSRAAGWALDLAFGLEAIGLSDPSHWISRDRSGEARIPTSPALRWEQAAEEEDGDGLLSVIRRWDCGAEDARLQTTSTTSVRQTGHPLVVDSNLTLPAVPSSLSITADIVASDGSPCPPAPTEFDEVTLMTGDRQLHKQIAPAVGSFANGDRARLTVDAEYVGEVRRDAIHVVRPARFLLWRLALSDEPLRLGPVQLRVYRVGEDLSDLSTVEEVRLEPSGPRQHELPFVSYALAFPPPHSLFVFEWEVQWR